MPLYCLTEQKNAGRERHQKMFCTSVKKNWLTNQAGSNQACQVAAFTANFLKCVSFNKFLAVENLLP
jgi:hypothetical protein